MPLSNRKFRHKVIITDCDGVLLNWIDAFHEYMTLEGYKRGESNSYDMSSVYPDLDKPESFTIVDRFNQSANIAFLEPLRDSVHYVKKLHEEHGYVFHLITSMTNDQYAQHLRIKNLIEVFGPSVFENYVFLDCGADKDEALYKYKDTECWWIEDKIANAEEGEKVGLRSLLMNHDHNRDYEGPIEKVYSWRDIYNRVLEQ